MLNLETIAVDIELAEAGVWMNYMGGRFLLRRKGAAYDNRLVELYNQNLDLIKSNTDEGNKKAVDIHTQAFSETVLVDWDGIVDANKTPIPYTPQIGFKTLSDIRFYELTKAMERFSAVHSNYQKRVEEEVAEDVKSSADS